MSLKQNIIVVNKFSAPTPSGKGTRGSTPGSYIIRYMARELASEPVTPIRRDQTEKFIQRYMAREEAVETIDVLDTPKLKRKMKLGQKNGGVAFGYGSASLSHDQLVAGSKDIQNHFNNGHTVMSTVLSFDQDYLKKHGLIDEEFQLKKRGDYRGQLDQLKLRLAIMRGLERMNNASYDELRYIGVIQVDTENVHCHLSMVDAGEGSLAADGTQRGKITARSRSFLRRGIDSYLDEKQHVRHLSSAVGYERRNVTTYVKRWAHQQMIQEALPQFLLATLPEDRRLWRTSTNHEAMRKPNRIVREMVSEVLQRPDSPMAAAMEKVHDYAEQRRKSEDLKPAQWQQLVKTGRERIIDRGANAVYSALRRMPEDALKIRTPMLDAMGMDYEEMAKRAHESDAEDETDLVGFGFRLRSFSSRMNHHTEKRAEYRELSRQWEAADEQGMAVPASRVLYEFYLEEEEYHARCAAKYRKFLPFTPTTNSWYSRWDKVSEYGERMLSLESMRKDTDLRKMKDPNEAEALGMEIYSQRGGHLVSLGTDASLGVLDERIIKMRVSYARQINDLRADLAADGLTLEIQTDEASGKDIPTIEPGTEYPFEEVKGLDLHHLRFDFSQDVEVGDRVRDSFVNQARRRGSKLEKAVEYLYASGQQEQVEDLPVSDIRTMNELADEVQAADSGRAVLPSQVAELAKERELLRRSRTVQLTHTLTKDLDSAIASVDYEIEPQTQTEPETEKVSISGPGE